MALRVMPRPGRLGWGHWGVPELAGVGNDDERAGGDGKEGAQRGWQRWGVGVSRGSMFLYLS